MIKRILKKIFPLLLLRKIALQINILKIRYYYPLIFPDYKTRKEDFVFNKVINPFIEINPSIDHLRLEVQQGLSLWKNEDWTQDEYLSTPSVKLFIEPEIGWAITSSRQLYKPSLGFSSAPYVRRPSLIGFLNRESNLTHFENAISFRDTGEENYFHFFNDVLAKFFLLKRENQINPDTPLIISEGLFSKEYFQYFYQKTYLKNYNWYVQKAGEYISVDYPVFCKPLTHSKYIYDEIKALLPIKDANDKEARRIFLTRNKASLRYIENQSECLSLLDSYGFQSLDASTISFEEQVELFSQTQYLIGVHGAGLSNMLFRKPGGMNVLEIFSPYSIHAPFHYVMLAHMYHHDYDALIGEKGKEFLTGGFRMDCTSVEQYLKSHIH